MKKGSNTTTLLIGAGVLGAGLLFLSKKSPTATQQSTSTTPGQTLQPGEAYPFAILPNHPPLPTTWNYAYYQQWIYPAMLQQNPNVGNSNYTLSQAELNQYLQNYSDLRGAIPSMVPHPFPNQNAFLQDHWKHNAVAEQRSFLPFLPTTTAPYTPPPANPNTSGGGSFWSTAGQIAMAVVAIAGPGDPLLNDYEAEILICGGYTAKQILPFYYKDQTALAAESKLDELLTQYTR